MRRPDPQTNPRLIHLVMGVVLGAGLLIGGAALAQSVSGVKGDLEAVESALEKGRIRSQELKVKTGKLGRDIRTLGAKLVAMGQKIHDTEDQATKLEGAIADLNRTKAEKKQRLAEGHAGQVSVIAALQRLSRHPPEALIAQPLSTNDIVRGAILLRATLPQIERQAQQLRAELDSLARTQAEIDAKRTVFARLSEDLKNDQDRIQSLLGQKRTLRTNTRAAQTREDKRVRALASKARNLKELFNQLEKDRLAREARERREAKQRAKADAKAKAQREADAARAAKTAAPAIAPSLGSAQIDDLSPPQNTRPISQARGKLWFPATGRVVSRYGQTEKTGLTRKGISIRTRKNAQVVATHDGRVVYAGTFRGYGQLLIIQHGEGYHSLISGLGRIDTMVGQWLLAGEPVGIMGMPDTKRPVLYLELRRNGQPINPLPWLAARTSKAS